jgi:hypothetical protein
MSDREYPCLTVRSGTQRAWPNRVRRPLRSAQCAAVQRRVEVCSAARWTVLNERIKI